MRPLQCAHTAWVEGTLIHSLTDLPLSHTEWRAHSLSHLLIHSLPNLTHRVECKLTHSIFALIFEDTLTPTLFHTQIGGHAHSLPLSHSLIHSLTHSFTLTLSHTFSHT